MERCGLDAGFLPVAPSGTDFVVEGVVGRGTDVLFPRDIRTVLVRKVAVLVWRIFKELPGPDCDGVATGWKVGVERGKEFSCTFMVLGFD